MLVLVLRLSGVSLVMCGLLLMVGVSVVHQQPLADGLLQGLAQCNRPCWAGIEPGRTAFDRVPRLVAVRHPGRRTGQMAGSENYSVNENGKWINIGGRQGIVTSVQLNLPLELWRLVLLYGSPTCLQPLESVTIIYWVFGDSQMVANFFPANNDWQSHTLVLQTGTADPCQQRAERQPWRGWAAF